MKKKEVSISQLSSDIKDALMKKALGYEVLEVSEEYGMVGDKLQVIKKKVNTKTYPPDLEAIEIALNDKPEDDGLYSEYSDDELLEEKTHLVELLKKFKKENKK